MRAVGGSVERAYLTSIEELREICQELSWAGDKYRIARFDNKEVTISYNETENERLGVLSFTFPILPYIWPYGLPGLPRRGEEPCGMVCLHVLVGRRTMNGSRADAAGEPWKDGVADWERFWPHLEAALITRSASTNQQWP